MVYATVEDMRQLWRAMSSAEMQRAEAIIPVVSDVLRVEAQKVGEDLDKLAEDPAYASVLKGVVVDIAARTLMTATDAEPVSSYTQSALGYSATMTYLSPGGGLFIKNSELERLGFRTQRYGVIDLWDCTE